MATRQERFKKIENIVISGISGVFPQCNNIEEFKQSLLDGKNLIKDNERWGTEIKNIPRKVGYIETVDRFDYSFFRLHRKQAEQMGISARMLLEKTFEAIVDAGYNPEQLKGKNIGVFFGAYDMEAKEEKSLAYEINEFTMFGPSQCLVANRISYWLDINGPSMAVDTACSSFLYAFECAYKSIQNGDCEGALVCAANIGISPYVSQCFALTGLLDAEGISRPFDAEAKGFVRAESAGVIFLQKRENARRIYAEVVHAKTNCDGFKQEGMASPSGKFHEDLYKQFYSEISVDLNSIPYIEAHGTGTKVGDVEEVNAIERFFCENRTTPLKLGSVKSNMGHGESSSGFCSIVKMIISFETGLIPPNLNLITPNPKINAFYNGNIEVITKPTPCEGDYFALNSFGVGGANAHILLTPHKKMKTRTDSAINDLPVLVTVSGRTEPAVNLIIKSVEENRADMEFIRLLHEVFSDDISGHLNRGYIIHDRERTLRQHQKIFSGEKRPIWFIFSGMGCQWPSMGKSLMGIPLFAESIHKSNNILRSKGVDLIKIITENDPQIFNNILNSFVGIAAIQIALCDILREIGINPDGIIGHSVGELGCAYADGCFTAEQMILVAYYRGLVSLETEFIHGTMAAVGVSYDITKDLVPPEIDVACHNGPDSCTISGPTDTIRDFMEELKNKKIFVREVNTSNIAYHSRYIASAGPKFISYLEKIIPQPKARSDKWICTSAPEQQWNTEKIKYSSAEYHTNNLLNPVLFEEGAHHIPKNAITIEIAPHGLLQSILKRSLSNTTNNIPLTLKNHENNAEFLLNAIGQLYEVGCISKISKLYPPVQFPVSRSTPMISPLIEWQHDEIWPVTKFAKKVTMSGERDIIIDPKIEDYAYLRDHVVDGKSLYPALGYLALIWETVAMIREENYKTLSIVFENVRFERVTYISTKNIIIFHISIQKNTGQFEISQGDAVVVTGVVRVPEDIDKEKIHPSPIHNEEMFDSSLNKKDFYKELRLRGYHYKGLFRNIVYSNTKGTYGKAFWRDNFVTFMDTMAQLPILSIDTRELVIPTFVRKIVIDVKKHFEILETLDKENPEFPIHYYTNLAVTSSGGIQFIDWKCKSIPRKRNQADPVRETCKFVPYISDEHMSLDTAIRLCVQIVLENLQTIKFKTIELLNQPYNVETPLISTSVADALSELPMIQASVNVLTNSEPDETVTENLTGISMTNDQLPTDKSCLVIIISNIWSKVDELEKIFDTLKDGGFIITEESNVQDKQFEVLGLNVCFSRIINSDKKILLLNKMIQSKSTISQIRIENTTYSWLSKIQQQLSSIKHSDEKLVVYSEKEPYSGILGFFNCLRKEENCDKARCFFIMDEDAPDFSLQNPHYKQQFDKELSHNIYKSGQWGSYRHLPLEPLKDYEVLHTYNVLEIPGDLSSFQWVEGSLNPTIHSFEKPIIHVYYSALNFRDVMLTSGKISAINTAVYNRLLECCHGIEYCGKDENGIRYMGIAMYKGIASLVEGDPRLMWKVPDHMTLEDASTIAVAYATVIYAFFVNMHLDKGSSVLIHAGSGAVGQAAINICLYYDCNIFVTVGTPEKVEFIKKTFPQIPESNIGNSRDTSFEKLILEQTNGRGVDVILNSLAEEKLRASVRCVAKHGHFIEIGKYDMAKNNLLEMGSFLKAINFHSIQLDDLSSASLQKQVTLHKTLQHMLNNGVLKPICRKLFEISEVESAFSSPSGTKFHLLDGPTPTLLLWKYKVQIYSSAEKRDEPKRQMLYMAAGKHIGKVVIKIRDEEKDIHAKPTLIRLNARPRVICQANSSYIIIGGLGGFGLELADWLIIRGARNIILSSRNGVKNGYQSYKLKLWESYDVNVVISTEDVTTMTGVTNLLQTGNKLGPVSGIFNVAVILKDGSFSSQTEETFAISAGPKAIATGYLDEQSRLVCPHLEHFVVFSSVSCGRGNKDQTNYGMSNSIMERICECRRADNLPALAIQWGAIGEVGVVADLAEDNLNIVIGGTLQQNVTSCLRTLDEFMKQPNSIVSSMVVAEKRHAGSDVINTVANILGIKDLKTICLTWTLPELGMDSMIAIEIKQVIESEFDIFLTVQDLKTMTFAKLYKLKEENMNTLKTGSKSTTRLELVLDENILNIPLLRIPFEEGVLEEIPVQNNPTAFILPGAEGVAKLMEPLAKHLSVQSLCFQYFNVSSGNDIFREFGEYFAQSITDRLGHDQEFFIIAYSVGTLFGLETIKILEAQGRKGHLWCIDGSPDYILSSCKELFKGYTMSDEIVQCFTCLLAVKSFIPDKQENELMEIIQKLGDWEAKKTFCYTIFSKKLYSESTVGKLLDRNYAIQKAILLSNQPPAERLETQCTLIRCAENSMNLDECYDLSKYFKYPVQIHQIESNHLSILGEKKTADIIMQNSAWKKN